MQQRRISPWPFVGLGALACLGFLYGGSLVFMPWWLVLALYVLWVPLVAVAARWFATKPDGVVKLAAAGGVLWLLAVALTAAVGR